MRIGALLATVALVGCGLADLSVSRAGDEVRLSWAAFGDGGYAIERKREGADWGGLARVPAGRTTFVDATVRPDVTYAYRIRAASGELSATAKSGDYTEDRHDPAAPGGGGATAGRRDLGSLSAADRARLVSAMLAYITDAVVQHHEDFQHVGPGFLAAHRGYIGGMEAHLRSRGMDLPRWDPATRIPAEFNVVKRRDDGSARPALVNLNPNVPRLASLAPSAIGRYTSEQALLDAFVPWHNRVHVAVGGTMSRIPTAPAAPIFWCWHAYVDDVYESWLRR